MGSSRGIVASALVVRSLCLASEAGTAAESWHAEGFSEMSRAGRRYGDDLRVTVTVDRTLLDENLRRYLPRAVTARAAASRAARASFSRPRESQTPAARRW